MALASKPKRPKRNPARSCLGPVADLEAHLAALSGGASSSTRSTSRHDGDVVENVENTRREVDFIVSAAAIQPVQSHPRSVLRSGAPLPSSSARRGFRNVVGVDRSRYLIRLARKARPEREPAGCVQGRRRAQSAARRLELRLRSSSWATRSGTSRTSRTTRRCFATVGKILRTGGQLVLDITDGAYMAENFEPGRGSGSTSITSSAVSARSARTRNA